MRCQVPECWNRAIYRCDNGFRYCIDHAKHIHHDIARGRIHARLFSIDRRGEFTDPSKRGGRFFRGSWR